MRKLGCVGASQYDIAERLLTDPISQWKEKWCFKDASDSPPHVFTPGKAQALLEHDWCSSASEVGGLWIAADWCTFLFARHATEAPLDRVLEELVSAAKAALCSSIWEALNQKHAPSVQRLAPANLDLPLDDRILVCFSFNGDKRLLVLLDGALLGPFFPRAPRELPLIKRADAIGNMKVKVRASLTFASLAIEDVDRLAVGDVLPGGAALDQPMNLTVADNKVVGKGFLAKKDGKVALQLQTDRN